jgi:signal transduction histidine kinase/CheY-like chemotaxis protein
LLLIKVEDRGKGIPNLEAILEGRYVSSTGMGMGIAGARRLVDQFEIRTEVGHGTTVWLKKVLPRSASLLTPQRIHGLLDQLSVEKTQDAWTEMQLQNQELLRTLEDLRKRQEDLKILNRELEDTNRGVVALYAELDEKADHLRRADVLKTRFLSNMSHEFRSPLNSILALSGLLSDQVDGPLNSEQMQQVKFIRKAAGDLYELVNDLLDLAKVEAGKVDIKPVHFEVENLFGALRGMLKPLFLNQSVALIFEDTDSLPALYSDEAKISQILRNFISNALKFTERGEVRVSARMADDKVLFQVADTGIGIAREDQERIFQDFVQVDNPIQNRVKGTGLGLPLSRKLANLLQGDVLVESEPGAGSVFSLQIPAHLAVEAPELVMLSEEEGQHIPVLCVEDRPDTVLMYAKWLKGTEFLLHQANSIREAEARMSAVKPRLILLDIALNGDDSWNLLASIKESEQTRETPVIVVSNVDDPGKAFHLGADEYLIKPVSRNALIEAIRRFTEVQRPARVLIIDDEESDRYLLKHRLRDLPVAVIEAANGAEGIAKAIVERPRVILLDLVMPGLSGFEVVEALKADPRTRSTAIVIQTSRVITGKDRERLEPQVAGILTKEQLRTEYGQQQLEYYLGINGIKPAGRAQTMSDSAAKDHQEVSRG